MARPLRIEYPGAVYHVTSRGNEKKAVYRDAHDRETFLNTLRHVTKRYNWLCHAYCLMDNHYHLLIETPDGNLSVGMRQLNGVYTQLFNRRHHRTGHLFQGRYKAILIQKDTHLLEVCRYIVLNPVRAGMVERPQNWQWSSYHATAGQGKAHPSLTIDWVLGQLSSNRSKAKKGYRQFVQAGMGKKSLWSEVKGQAILGDDTFVASLIGYLTRHKDVAEIPKTQRYVNRPTLDQIFQEDILRDKGKRDKKIVEAVDTYGYRQSEISRHVGMHYSTISNLLRRKG